MEKIALIVILSIILIQDVKMRAVYWFLFPLLGGIAFWYNYKNITAQNLLWNGTFVLFSMIFLTLYVSIKQKKLTAIWNGFFSWGDILFLIVITPIFTFSEYLLFFTAGTILTLVFHAVAMLFFRDNKTVPYAGYMSLSLILFLIFQSVLKPLTQLQF